MKFAANLKRLRKAAKLSQEGLALACGWSGQSRVGNYESGLREPELDEIPTIARALGVQVGELFGEAPSHSQPVRLDPLIVRRVATALSERYKSDGGYSLADKAEEFVRAYELWVGMSDAYDEPEIFNLVIRHADLSPQGASGNERGSQDAAPAGAVTEGIRPSRKRNA
ncbi:helix-turn-helix transcriptional regulator [Rhodanobacter sp. LX-99]|uniref:helix-turn-helix domain-containing protein n=1 Tax=Rhodanobacter sp. LX-99 TaxID=2838834 RepID=UPI001BDE4442|nr:helix-turn-helix transcriptional regulator [Rhodanobacter sp. LX-99]MBT2142715.1 helix-turn-helix domain-containing protein [Rhodanobacter sp. LX-99]MBT2148212.1 helix-turn-helix domain-containing protein [Rhodanobacter sp. LX-100]